MKEKSGRSDVHPVHRFHPWQVWPGSYENPPVEPLYPLPDLPRPRIDRATPIAGIGSCFIREMMVRLQKAGYSFPAEEIHKPGGKHASAAWERLYNLFSVRQVLEYTFLGRTQTPRWWVSNQSGRIQDPYRRIMLYDTLEEAEADFADHCITARRVLTTARVLLVSLDYVEIWEDRETGAVICLPSGPYFVEGGDLRRYRFRVSRLAENLEALEDIYQIFKRFNPDGRLILLLSPIQQWVTFRDDMDVLSASFNSKATLRAAADEFVSRHPDVSYFPAYEIAMLHRPIQGLRFFAEGRENYHVDHATCDAIVKEFIRWYDGEG
ncbi:MAG: GSCFA domain-containing protein [Deltaproteobacteria bacterium]